MTFPDPQSGRVICYSYLWKEECDTGEVDGRKDRPCVIVGAVAKKGERYPTVAVMAITHTEPKDMSCAVEIPQAVKARMGLDHQRSWIVCSELNQFKWPGPDIRPIARNSNAYDYGFLPPKLLAQIQHKVELLSSRRKFGVVMRTDAGFAP